MKDSKTDEEWVKETEAVLSNEPTEEQRKAIREFTRILAGDFKDMMNMRLVARRAFSVEQIGTKK